MKNSYGFSPETVIERMQEEMCNKPSHIIFSLDFAEYLLHQSKARSILTENPEVEAFVKELSKKFPEISLHGL